MTGANRGFGAACVEVFSENGWDVVGTSRSPQPVDATKAVRWARWDVTDDDVSPLTDLLGGDPVHVLINNAGAGTPGTPLAGVDVGTLLDVCNVNVGGVIRATRAILPNLLHATSPLVLNISSRLGSVHDQAAGRYRDFTTSYAYRISKAAQNMATTCLANELAPRVRVCAVHPGSLATGMARPDSREDPLVAARRLFDLAVTDELRTASFLNLEGGEIAW